MATRPGPEWSLEGHTRPLPHLMLKTEAYLALGHGHVKEGSKCDGNSEVLTEGKGKACGSPQGLGGMAPSKCGAGGPGAGALQQRPQQPCGPMALVRQVQHFESHLKTL